MLTDTPDITVNGTTIPASAIDTEVQYHPAENRREAMAKAAESLIIAEVVKQRIVTLGLCDAEAAAKDSESEHNIETLLQQEVAIPAATEEECLRYYEANQQKFQTAPLIEAKHILLAADPEDINARSQAKTLAENLVEQLTTDPGQFKSLAQQFSACPSKDVGGSLGQISHGQTVPEFQRQLFAASSGLMKTPVETRYGFHIVFIERKIDGKQLPYEQVKDRVAEYLNEKVQRKAIAQYLHNLIAEADIQGYAFDIEPSSLMQ